jgi:hypothetical protein
MDIARSVNGVPIRLTEERWSHIVMAHDYMTEYHDDVLRTLEHPDFVLRGRGGSLRAVRGYGAERYLVVTYRELANDDGFVITAYFVRRVNRRHLVWRR